MRFACRRTQGHRCGLRVVRRSERVRERGEGRGRDCRQPLWRDFGHRARQHQNARRCERADARDHLANGGRPHGRRERCPGAHPHLARLSGRLGGAGRQPQRNAFAGRSRRAPRADRRTAPHRDRLGVLFGRFHSGARQSRHAGITAADAKHPSFGCQDGAQWTYFGDAFFNTALRRTANLKEAFAAARILVRKRERQHGFAASNPQMAGGENIARLLRGQSIATVPSAKR